MEAMVESSRMSSSKETDLSKRRSTLSAPITSLPILIGTQRKEMSDFFRLRLALVLSRKRGLSEILGMTAGLPV